MIDKYENMLIVLGEELAEVQKEIAKCLRFTPYSVHPDGGHPNEYKLQIEMQEAIAIFEDLRSTTFSYMSEDEIDRIQTNKLIRVKEWYENFDKDAVEI